MKMTVQQARKLLPKGCESFAPHAVTVVALRDAVMQELEEYALGCNPLSLDQRIGFHEFLEATA